MPFVACKLPSGLEINHNGQRILLLGANIGEDLENVSRNGSPTDNEARRYGYGLTELDAKKAEAFEHWAGIVTYKNGKDGEKLADPFLALENGAIMGPFASKADAIKEIGALHSSVTTGMEGLDPTKEGVEDSDDEEHKKGVKRKTS